MKDLLLIILCLLLTGCAVHESFLLKENGGKVSEDQYMKDVYECYYGTHWRSTENLAWPIYGSFYGFYYLFSSLKQEEDAAALECFKNREYKNEPVWPIR